MRKHGILRSSALFVARKHPWITAALILTIIAAIVLSVLPPLVLQRAVNSISGGNGAIAGLAGLYFGLTALSGLAESGESSLITVFGQKIMHHFRSEMCAKLSRLPASYFSSHDAGSVESRFMNDVEAIDVLFTDGLIGMFVDSFKVISILIVVFQLSTGLGIMLLIALPLLFLFTRFVQKRMLAAQIDNRRAVAASNRCIPESIHNLRTIHLYHREKYMEKRYHNTVHAGFQAMERSNFYDAVYSPVILTVSSLIVAAMMILAVQNTGMQSLFGMTVGTVVALIAYVEKIFSPLENIGMEIQNIQAASAGFHRIREFMAEPEIEQRFFQEQSSAEMPAVQIRHVTFGYEPSQPVFRDFSLDLAKGESVTLTGRTGAGKSTLFKLLMGLYRPQSGSILIQGIPADAIQPSLRRKTIGIVEQKFHPVIGTVRDQITLGDPAIDDKMVLQALDLVGLSDAYSKRNEPFDTESYSQGQLQLFSIARAVVTNPQILLLDEITASLDSATEQRVLSALKAASGNRTVLSISHRLYEQTGGRRVEIERGT